MNSDQTVTVALQLTGDQLDQLVEAVAAKLADTTQTSTPAKRWLTVPEAADYISAKPQRIYDLRSSGRLSRCGDGGRALVDCQELDRLIGGV